MLGLKTIRVIEKAFEYINKPYPRAYEINWNDKDVWDDISNDNTALFQFESNFSGQLLKQMHPNNIKDLSLVNACVRPSGESYRNKLTKHEINYNADERVADLLSDSYGFLCIEENQLVETKRGLIPIRDVAVGDYVVTRKGWNKVLKAQKTGYKPVVEIYYNNTSIKTTLDHQLLTQNGWVQAGNIVSDGHKVYYYNREKQLFQWAIVTDVAMRERANVYDLTVENEHEFTCQGIIVHNCYQEQQIKFMQQICGLTGSQADTVRRAIGKKSKEVIDSWLPKILDGYCNGSSKPREQAEQEAMQYIKILEDAASYSFGYNHSISYSMLGYLCGYLKHYYPKAFISAFLNCANNEDDINNGTALAKKLNIKIIEPRFRHSKAEYFFDEKEPKIYKGMSSIKFMNEKVSNELYELRNNKYNTFVDLLYDISNLSINSRQLDILIRLDFFEEFGNSNELLGIYTMFDYFKQGKAKTISKDKLKDNEVLQNIVARYSSETEKQYTKLQTREILNEICAFIKSQNRKDFSYQEKAKFQMEYLGYINLSTQSNDEKERRKLIILSIKPLKAKTGKNIGKIWCYAVTTQSIGSGKIGHFTVLKDVYEKTPIKEYDVIFADYVYSKNNYWYLGKYYYID